MEEQTVDTEKTESSGAKLYEHPDLHMGMVKAMFATPDAFVSMCMIVREDETTGFMEPTYTQRKLLKAYAENRWVMVNKFRQAKITTVSVMLLLRDCMYLSGVKGLLIAERQDTAEDIFERIRFAYEKLPDNVRVPLTPGKKAGTTQMQFIHGGGIKVLTAGGRSPAIGRSIDRLIITEYGEAQWQRKAAINIFPTVNKRPNARVILESTPGRSGSHHEQMWRSALEGNSRFKPLFLEWWEDESCQEVVPDFIPTSSEQEYRVQHDGMSNANLAFRRRGLNTEFVGDSRLFSCKYPSDAYDGWLGSTNPIMPADLLKPWLEKAGKEPDIGQWGCHEFHDPKPGHNYLITADPAGFGSTGDKSALTVWDATDWVEVAFWEDREAPDRFAARLIKVQQRYLTALIAVESNAAACITVLKDRDVKNLLWTDRNHPGWYATNKRIQESEARLVQMLRQGDLTIQSRGMLHQLLNYDGSRKKRIRGEDGTIHHFDRARTAVMAADILSKRHFAQEAIEVKSDHVPGQVTIKQLDKYKALQRRQKTSPFKPATQAWK